MRTLSASLLAAQQSASHEPYVEVVVSNRVADVTRLGWTPDYSASLPDDAHSAAADGDYLHRVRVRAGDVEYERDAGSGWTGLHGASATVVSVVAINDERVVVAYNLGGSLYIRESTDQGGSWDAPVNFISPGVAPEAIAVAYKNAAGDLAIVWEENGAVKRIRRTSGTFGSAATWTESMATVTGLAMTYFGDYNVAITGTDGDDRPVVAGTVLGDGFFYAVDTWAALQYIAEAEDGAGVTFGAPSMVYADTHRLAFVESYSGPSAYDRPQLTWFPPSLTFGEHAWREPVPFDLDSPRGVAIAANGTTAYLSRPDATWSAPLASPETDLTADMLAIDVRLRRESGEARVVLRNDDGRYHDLASGPYATITRGAQLEVRPGYTTAAGNERSSGLQFWIDRWEYTSEGGRATLVLHARDVWSLVEAWRARRQHRWTADEASVSQILRFVCGRAAVEVVNVGASAAALNHKPEFTVHPGEDGLRATGRLLAMVPDALRATGDELELTELQETDVAVYSYGTDHDILRGRYGAPALAANRVQAFGDGELSEAFAWEEIDETFDRLRQVFDLNLTSASKADDRAAATLRQEALDLALGEIVTPVNCGQELHDVIEVTDANAGLSAAPYRVQGIELRYAREGRAVYQQRLLLGRV